MNTKFLKAYAAEFLGTFWLVFGGCGCAILAANGQVNGIGALGVSLAFGLSVLTAIIAFGGISGGHFNPAVTVGMIAAGRLPVSRAAGYVLSQVGGAFAAALVLYVVASGQAEFGLAKGFAANGFGAHSPNGYGLGASFLMETICTAFFILIILSATASAAATAAPIIIGAMLTLIHLVLIPITNASVNPARSTSQALIVGDWAIGQLWVFWLAPVVGAVLGVSIYRLLTKRTRV